MIICPTCREEIEDDSCYCDQCGQALLFCQQCGRVGIGRRCTHCGGLMAAPAGLSKNNVNTPGDSVNISYASFGTMDDGISRPGVVNMPVMTLSNESLNIRIVAMNGAIIGRRQGPYIQFFEKQSYVSGVHAQLKYNPRMGWCVTDKHSSNGTKLNQRPVLPDVEMTLKNGDILTIANVSLQVNIR